MAMMVHPAAYETCASTSSAITDLQVDCRGRESHAALAPERGVNSADALTVAHVAIGLLRQHLEARQQVHGIVTDGGVAPNIVPAHTSALYYLRAADAPSLQRLEARIRDCFAAGARAARCVHEVTQASPVYVPPTPDGERARPVGSTDMGNVTQVLPAIHPTIAIDCADAVNHQPEFALGAATPSADRAVLDGAVTSAWAAMPAASDDSPRARLPAGVGARRRDGLVDGGAGGAV
jgi:metal-dependent amidase/aminoacylase/carboxypeptidase family protein